MQNGYANNVHRDIIAEIKAAAKEQTERVRGASATSLLRSAREQIQLARVNENDGDLRGALSAYTKAAYLTAMYMDTSEFKLEMPPGKKGALMQDMKKFQQVCAHRSSCPVLRAEASTRFRWRGGHCKKVYKG